MRAVQIAQHVEGPVQVIWTREEDIQHDMYRPYYYDRLSAGVDAHGKAVAWSHRIAGSSIIARYAPSWIKDGVDPDAVEGSADQPYGIERHPRRLGRAGAAGRDPTAFWRGVGVTRGTFAVESFVDELAAHAKQDPLAIASRCSTRARARRPCCSSPRTSRAGAAAAGRAGPRHRALHRLRQLHRAGRPGQRRQGGAVTPTHVWCVVDCGIVVNPDTIRAQMEGGIVFGLSGALYGEITIKDGRVEQTNFGDYRVLRINETPLIDVHIVEEPGGTRRHRRAGNVVRDAGVDQRDLRREWQADPQAAGRHAGAPRLNDKGHLTGHSR